MHHLTALGLHTDQHMAKKRKKETKFINKILSKIYYCVEHKYLVDRIHIRIEK